MNKYIKIIEEDGKTKYNITENIDDINIIYRIRNKINKNEKENNIKLLKKIIEADYVKTSNFKDKIDCNIIYDLFKKEQKDKGLSDKFITNTYITRQMNNIGFKVLKGKIHYYKKEKDKTKKVSLKNNIDKTKATMNDRFIEIVKKYDNILPKDYKLTDEISKKLTFNFYDIVNDIDKMNKIIKDKNKLFTDVIESKKYEPVKGGIIFRLTNKNSNKIVFSRTTIYTFFTVLIRIANAKYSNITRHNKVIYDWGNEPKNYTITVEKIIKYSNSKEVIDIYNNIMKENNKLLDNTTKTTKTKSLKYTLKKEIFNNGTISAYNEDMQMPLDEKYNILIKELKKQNILGTIQNYKKGKIYMITNTDNNITYIGSTCLELNERFQHHIYNSKFIWECEYKNPEHHFKIELIEKYPCGNNLELLLREDYYITKNNTIKNGYNQKINSIISMYIYNYARFYKTKMHDDDMNNMINGLKQVQLKFNYIHKYTTNLEILEKQSKAEYNIKIKKNNTPRIFEFINKISQKKYVCYGSSLNKLIVEFYNNSIYYYLRNTGMSYERKRFIKDFIQHGLNSIDIISLYEDVDKSDVPELISEYIKNINNNHIYNRKNNNNNQWIWFTKNK